jgi:hypothetical protein
MRVIMLLASQRPGKIEASPSSGDGSVEALRQIIALREQREVGYDEAQEVGASLIEFYQLLAEESDDDAES